jgi:N-acetylglucosamine-6-phosphate deacetylase
MTLTLESVVADVNSRSTKVKKKKGNLMPSGSKQIEFTPGFWDLHIHGACGVDFFSDPSDACVAACEALGKRGTEFIVPTLLSAPEAASLVALRKWAKLIERARSPSWPAGAARPLGIHLEGPFLSQDRSGAHPSASLRAPSKPLLSRFLAAANGHLRILTLAPELKGSTAVIQHACRAGVRVQLGHTEAGERVLSAAYRHGARGATHLWNAMSIHHRDPGVLTLLESHADFTGELIHDLAHVHSAVCQLMHRSYPGQVYAVSDACSALGGRAHASSRLGPVSVCKGAHAAVVEGTHTLAGGATWLTDHPRFIWSQLAAGRRTPLLARRLLDAFYRPQLRIFAKWGRPARSEFQNRFDLKTLRWLGRT